MSELTVGSLSGLAANSYVIDVASGSQLTQPGMVLQVVSTTKTDTFSTATTASFVDVTGLSVSITPSSASSKIMILVSVMLGNSGTNEPMMVQTLRDSTPIGVSTGTLSGGFVGTRIDDNAIMQSGSMNHLDSPATTSAITYKVQIYSAGSTAYVNRRGINDAFSGVSSITALEIAA